ncbi:Glyoxalase/Bleomycin resistance protein/Dihydroxybiphenyl dioxygenase [Cadophora sp. MPI-SDFR-AT-0126]|nr:Glyoxalase/Bleomycin resistance protein/Dihydroxybiphenyl dioxygenase [Leotiomycetes sp. MPI-SDFR-AT-0126]
MAPLQPKIQFERLLYTHYQHQNLAATNKFFTDFGLTPVQQTENTIYYRGFGDSPYIYVAERSPDRVKHFIGGGWVVKSKADLEAASKLPGASKIQDLTTPGGGEFVDVKDPQGVNIRLIYGITYRPKDKLQDERPKPVVFNTWEDKPRRGEFQRFESGPSKVHKLGHYGLVVDKSKFESTVAWYLDTFSLKPTDSLFDQESGKDMMTFMHIDKGEEYTDHHSFFIQSPSPPVQGSHPHHSSFEVDNMDTQLMGHHHLESEGWTNCWGVGRHLLGSQIFDYWFDNSGNIVEHYSDGDLVNNKHTLVREVAAPDTMAVWGPNVTLAFLTGSIEDIAKGSAIPKVKKIPTVMTEEERAPTPASASG